MWVRKLLETLTALSFEVKLKIIPRKPIFHYILNIKMTSQSLSNFCIELRAVDEWLCDNVVMASLCPKCNRT